MLKRIVVQFHWQIRGLLVTRRFYRVISKLRHGEKCVGDSTDIIIDGFPRSGNTFAVTAFKYAQRRDVNVSSHIHAPIEIITAVKRNIPAIVLVRDPEDAAISFMIMLAQNVSAEAALKYYIRFYEALLPFESQFVTCSFETTTANFGAAIEAVNDRCGSEFSVFDHTEENVNSCFDIIDREYREWRGEIRELNVSRPSDSRKDLKEQLRKAVRDPRIKDVHDRAYNVYNTFLKFSEQTSTAGVR
ncbi:MAG: hypothetical protein HKN43_01240 [Rhodothermales bacterium]|nr:hypothetical protein [Rhodothermales bacterium]